MSVVTEPDLTKLNLPEKRNSETETPPIVAEVTKAQPDVVALINDAYRNLETVVDGCYSVKPGW